MSRETGSVLIGAEIAGGLADDHEGVVGLAGPPRLRYGRGRDRRCPDRGVALEHGPSDPADVGDSRQNSETERYRLGRQAFLLGRAAGKTLGFDAAMPMLERLAEETGESVNLVVRDGDQGLVVLRVESQQPLRFMQSVGARIPLYCTSTGKVLLAFGGDLNREVARLGELERLTSSTITSPRRLLEELTAVRDRQFSVNKGERIPGVCGVAAPLLGPSGVAIAAWRCKAPSSGSRTNVSPNSVRW